MYKGEALEVIEGILQRYCDFLYEAEDIDEDKVWKAFTTVHAFLTPLTLNDFMGRKVYLKEPIIFDTGKALKHLKKYLTNYSQWSWEPEEFDEDEMWKAFKTVEDNILNHYDKI